MIKELIQLIHIPYYWNHSAIASTQRTFDCPSLAIDKQKPIILQKWHWSSLSIVIGIFGIYSRWRYCNRPKLSRFNRLSDLSICTIPLLNSYLWLVSLLPSVAGYTFDITMKPIFKLKSISVMKSHLNCKNYYLLK